MDPQQPGDRKRKRKSPVTPQSASRKRRGPDTATSRSRIMGTRVSERLLAKERASTSHEAPSPAEKFLTVPSDQRVTLEGDTLGEKHRHFNKLVEDAVANKNYELRNISSDDSDIDNLLKIAIASRNRNVEYIIEVMKSNDMLYAATAIKKSTWLITEPQYANIINPEYLHTQLLPRMNTKMFKKLMLHIRLNLKDESRVETFFIYLVYLDHSIRIPYRDIDYIDAEYNKWLENCSIPFIDDVAKRGITTISLYKRLLKRSINVIAHQELVMEPFEWPDDPTLFLFKSQTAHVLNKLNDYSIWPDFGKKNSEILMKKYPKKVFDDFEKYVKAIDLTVVAKYLKKKEIKKFLYEQTKKTKETLWAYHNLRHFIKHMPEDEGFNLVKKVFIDKTEPLSEDENDSLQNNAHIKRYKWFEFAPFNEALTELTKLVREETSPSERCAMLSILISCTRKNSQNIKTLLLFYNNLFIDEVFTSKILFVNDLLSQISTHEFDNEAWNVLDQLFNSVEVYTESQKDVQMCLKSIVLYKVLHDEPVPEIVKEKLAFNTFEDVQRKLNVEQRSKIFTFLLNFVWVKLQCENITNESGFSETIDQLENALILLRNWGKDISNYPSILQKIQELIKIRQNNKWKTDMSCLYNVNKSWRKHMFEESLSLCLSEEVCLNALKHKPQLLMHHDKQIDTLRTDDAVSLRRLLAKLRVYWPHSLAQHFTDAYLLHLNRPTGHKAVIKGLFILLPQNLVIDIAIKHIPDDSKVNWGVTEQNEISIRQNIAKHLHVARPLIPLDTVLWYAKGDYLQYTVPSLNAILSQLNEAEIYKYVPKLLDAPVSLQKLGLNLAASKLKPGDLREIFLKIWKTSKNLTIRSVIFKHTHDQICKATNAIVQNDLWKVLSTFIDNLTAEESEDIYARIGTVQNVPISIRAKYYMKSYEFLNSLPASANCEDRVDYLRDYAPRVMDALDDEFVASVMLSSAGTKFCSYKSVYLEVFACYVLCGKSEEDQLLRFRRVVEPAIDKAFQLWDSTRSGDFYIRHNYDKFLRFLTSSFRMYYLNTKILPVKLFLEIKTKMEKELPLVENYVLHTSWKLVTEYVKVMDEYKFDLNEMFDSDTIIASRNEHSWMSNVIKEVWRDIHIKISPPLAAVIVKCLKHDIEQYNAPTIYSLFTKAFDKMFADFYFQDEVLVLETLQHVLNDYNFVPSYCLVSKATPKYNFVWSKCKLRLEMRKKLESHPSTAVRMHYYDDFQKYLEDDNDSDSE